MTMASIGIRQRKADTQIAGVASRGLTDYLAPLEHESLLVRRGRRSGLYNAVAVHSTVRGPSLGGCRIWVYPKVEHGVSDVLRLSKAMTLKSAVADLPLGGGKGVIILEDAATALDPDRRRQAFTDFAETVEMLGGTYITAEDVGSTDADMEVIAQKTSYVTGLSHERGGSGDPSPWTALGVQAAMEVGCQEVWGSNSVSDRKVVVVGLGHVGSHLARNLARVGADVSVTDIDPQRRVIADEISATWLDPEQALIAETDILAPCALGGIFTHESIATLRCQLITGAANNQLASDDIADELAQRDILWIPDFVANAGGIVNISIEFLPDGYHEELAHDRVMSIGDTVSLILERAHKQSTTPFAAAMELAHERLSEHSQPH